MVGVAIGVCRGEAGDHFVLDRRESILTIQLCLDRSGFGDFATELGPDITQQGFVERRRLDYELLLAHLLTQLFDRGRDLFDLGVGNVECVENFGLGYSVRASFDHQNGLVGARDDQVEIKVCVIFLVGIDNEVTIQLADPNRADVGCDRNLGDSERCGGTVHREDVIRMDVVN